MQGTESEPGIIPRVVDVSRTNVLKGDDARISGLMESIGSIRDPDSGRGEHVICRNPQR